MMTINELIQEIRTGKGNGSKRVRDIFMGNECSTQFCDGITGIDDYLNHLNKGLNLTPELLTNDEQSNKQILVPSVSGEFSDPVAYINGEPECMQDFHNVDENKYLSIQVEPFAHAKFNTKILAKKSLLLANRINQLETSGIRCKIIYAVNSTGDGKPFELKIKIKDFEDNYINNYHSAIIGHVATFRGLCFAYMSQHIKKPSLGYARPAELEPDTIRVNLVSDSDEKIKSIS